MDLLAELKAIRERELCVRPRGTSSRNLRSRYGNPKSIRCRGGALDPCADQSLRRSRRRTLGSTAGFALRSKWRSRVDRTERRGTRSGVGAAPTIGRPRRTSVVSSAWLARPGAVTSLVTTICTRASIAESNAFWLAVWEYFDVQSDHLPTVALSKSGDARRDVVRGMPHQLRRAGAALTGMEARPSSARAANSSHDRDFMGRTR